MSIYQRSSNGTLGMDVVYFIKFLKKRLTCACGNPRYDRGGSTVSSKIFRKKIYDLITWEKLGHKMERKNRHWIPAQCRM